MKFRKYILSVLLGLIYVSMMGFFTYKCLETGNKSAESSNRVAEVVKDVTNEVFNTNIELTESYTTLIRKLIGHFGYFVCLGIVSILFYASLKKNKIFTITTHYAVGLLFAFFSEFCLEGLTEGRSASFKDVMMDFSGFITISSIMIIVYFIVLYRKKAKIEKQEII